MFRLHLGALALVAAFAFPLAASAQTIPAPGGPAAAPAAAGAHHRRHGDPYMQAMRSLQLSDPQKQQIRGFMEASRTSLRRQIEGVLTNDQRAQLRARLAQTRGRMGQPNGPSRPASPQ